MSVIQAEVEVDETNIPNVQLGQLAKITIDALPEKSFKGHVTEIGNSPTPCPVPTSEYNVATPAKRDSARGKAGGSSVSPISTATKSPPGFVAARASAKTRAGASAKYRVPSTEYGKAESAKRKAQSAKPITVQSQGKEQRTAPSPQRGEGWGEGQYARQLRQAWP